MKFSESRTAEMLEAAHARADSKTDPTTMTDIMLLGCSISAAIDNFIPPALHKHPSVLQIHEMVTLQLKMSLALRAVSLPEKKADEELKAALAARTAMQADLLDLAKNS
jgi:hypothetical protein